MLSILQFVRNVYTEYCTWPPVSPGWVGMFTRPPVLPLATVADVVGITGCVGATGGIVVGGSVGVLALGGVVGGVVGSAVASWFCLFCCMRDWKPGSLVIALKIPGADCNIIGNAANSEPIPPAPWGLDNRV